MTLAESLKIKKRELEKKVSELIHEFSEETEFFVHDIEITQVRELSLQRVIRTIVNVRLDI